MMQRSDGLYQPAEIEETVIIPIPSMDKAKSECSWYCDGNKE